MPSLFVLDVAEYRPIWKNAVGDSELEIRSCGPYVELRFPDGVTIDRAATGVRHAVWYSGVAAVADARVVRFDKTLLRVVADDSTSSTRAQSAGGAPKTGKNAK